MDKGTDPLARKKITLSPRLGVLLSLFGTYLLSLELTPGEPRLPALLTFLMLALQLIPFLILAGAFPSLVIRLRGAALNLILLVAALFLWALLSSFWSGLADLSMRRALLVFIPALTLILLVYCERDPLRTFWSFARGMVYIGVALSLLGLFLYFFGSTVFLTPWEGIQVFRLGPFSLAQVFHTLASRIRISSLTGNPNSLAAYLMVSLVFTLALYSGRRLSLAGFLLLGGIQGLAMLLTYSRAGLGSLIIAVAICFFFTARGVNTKIIRVFLALAIILVLLFFMFGFISEGLEGAFLQRTTALSLREQAWSLVWNAFMERPFTGVGYGVSFESILQPAGIVRRTHNAHLGTLSEVGLIGYFLLLGAWLLGVAYGFYRARRCLGRAGGPGIAFVAIFALLTVLLLHQFFENLIPRYGFHTIYWIYLLAVATHPNPSGKAGEDTAPGAPGMDTANTTAP